MELFARPLIRYFVDKRHYAPFCGPCPLLHHAPLSILPYLVRQKSEITLNTCTLYLPKNSSMHKYMHSVPEMKILDLHVPPYYVKRMLVSCSKFLYQICGGHLITNKLCVFSPPQTVSTLVCTRCVYIILFFGMFETQKHNFSAM